LFNDFSLSPSLLKAVAELGYTEPTPIQQRAIPVVLEGRDLMAAAQTGTGKTAAFALPLLERLLQNPAHQKSPRALILVPTRELAAQVSDACRVLAKNLPIRGVLVYGGVSARPQLDSLSRGVDLVIATPGRLLDHLESRAVDLSKIEMLVLEAIACARSSIQIMTPYFLPDDRIITALALAAMRNVTVDIVLPEHSNHPTVDWAMRAHIGPLLAADCRVWTHKPPFDHSKLMAVDGIWCLVGSANWDMRSFRLNFEINLEVYRSALVEQVSAKITANQTTRLLQADLDRRSLPVRLRDNAAHLMLPYL